MGSSRLFVFSGGDRIISIRRLLQVLLVLGVTSGCLAYAVAGMDWEKLRQSAAQADYRMLLPMSLILVAFYALKGWRWALLLHPVRNLTTWQVTPAMMTGFMANNLLPAHLGEFVRVLVLGQQFGLKKTPVLSTVVLERVFDILAVLLLLGTSLFFVEGMPDELRRACHVFGVVSLGGVAVLLSYMLFTQHFIALARRILGWIPFVPASLSERVLEMLETAAHGLASVRNPRLLAGISVSSLLQWMLNGLMVFCAARAFGVPLTYFDSLMVMGIIVFAILLPSPPGYFGVMQACYVAVLVPRFPQEDVVACSVFYQMSQFIPVTLVGFVFMNRIGLSLGRLQSAAAAGANPDATMPTDIGSVESEFVGS
ncbi:MAG: flippase-like domain-containing protein [Planctomycetaceae bacterium]|nr:flippase-like domain-containing protein [Planctomycetaceae bacterium]